MKLFLKEVGFLCCLVGLFGCATVETPPIKVEAPVSRVEQQAAQKENLVPEAKVYKRRVAIARFTNESRYGKSLLRDDDLDPLGKQASDMLASRLIASNKFLVLERPDLNKILDEQQILKESGLVGSDTLIMGSVTEFGRFTAGQSGFLSNTKNQIAKAKVDIRLINTRTGLAFFSAIGSGETNTESGEVAGFGSKASYDATLNDRAIAAAISDVLNEIIAKLEERPWRTDILKVDGQSAYISGGKHQGIKVGDRLAVMKEGEKVESKQSGFEITLPPTRLAVLEVLEHFGDSEVNEGSVCAIVDGDFSSYSLDALYVTEDKEITQ